MAAIALKRPAPRRNLVSIVSMIDVMMILLFFFMVTSSYLNLDMIPALQKSDASPSDAPATPAPGTATTLMIRIAADGSAAVRGQTLDAAALSQVISTRLKTDPLTPVVLFPSGGAELQALISVMDTVTKAGAVRVRVIRLAATK